jgi:LCP family protein required for cell wall assembly
VRTTLKRGHGRTALDSNGSGRATLPPDALSAMTLYAAEPPPPKSRLRRTGRVLGWILLGLVVVASGLGGGVYLWLHEAVGAIELKGPEARNVDPQLAPTLPHQPTIALVLGYDHRTGQGSAPSRSDTMMLLRADPRTNTISMLSFPRDLQVDIKCPSKGDLGLNKINAAYSFCGAAGSLATVKALTGLPVNYLMTVDFRGFKKIVNILGGVWVDVDRRYFNNQGGPYGYAKINLQPGYQRLTGGSALDFVRFRHTDSDIYRVARQQLFVQAMKEQFASSFSVGDIPRLVGAVSDNVKIGLGGGHHLSLGLLAGYAGFARDLPSGHFFQAKISNLTGASDLTTDTSNITAAIHEFLTPNIKEQKDANTVAFGGHVKETIPKPAQTSIVALNGNGVAGSASDAKIRLAERGYRMLEPPNGKEPNAPTFDYFHTKVYYQSWIKRAKAAAGSLAAVMAPADTAPLPRALVPVCGGGTMLCIVVGKTYHNSITPQPPAQPTIKHQAPSVFFDRSATEGLVHDAQRTVPFPLMVPNVIESSSSPDTVSPDVPIRVYRVSDKQKAVRLVFRRGGVNEYWGIEETDWQDAPVLAERSFHRFIGGRSYSLYYHGTHLHMVVLHVGKTGYWVVNTLVDSLSNETMLAIAKGLQPLGKAGTKVKT